MKRLMYIGVLLILLVGCTEKVSNEENEELLIERNDLVTENRKLNDELNELKDINTSIKSELEKSEEQQVQEDYNYLFELISKEAYQIQEFFENDSREPYYILRNEEDLNVIEGMNDWILNNEADSSRVVIIREILYVEDRAVAHCVYFDKEYFEYDARISVLTGFTPYRMVTFFMNYDNEEWKVTEFMDGL